MDVSFQEEKRYAPAGISPKRSLGALVVRMGFARDESQASQILIGLVVVCGVAIAGIWFFAGGSKEGPSLEEVQRLQQLEGVR